MDIHPFTPTASVLKGNIRINACLNYAFQHLVVHA